MNQKQPQQRQKRILAVDDEPDLTMLCKLALEYHGFELYNKLKEKDKDIKVCFLTASELYYQEFRKEEYYAIDKNLFIRKPIANEELLKVIKNIMNSC